MLLLYCFCSETCGDILNNCGVMEFRSDTGVLNVTFRNMVCFCIFECCYTEISTFSVHWKSYILLCNAYFICIIYSFWQCSIHTFHAHLTLVLKKPKSIMHCYEGNSQY